MTPPIANTNFLEDHIVPHAGRLTLIGAGPGDPELLTLKAIKTLEMADVVLYDALVDPVVLEYAKQAETIFVGKRKGCYAYIQEHINELIVQRALQGKHVVRLKGGDPFVFGRGAEEMQFAAQFGVETDLIPGISSCTSVPALQHIPVTKRGAAQSFWVLTGTTREHQISGDIALAAQSNATVVILMGMGKFRQIMTCFMENGRHQLPVAVIQEGATPRERIVVGTVMDIEDKVKKAGLSNPAIIIIGEVVNHRASMKKIEKQIKNSISS
ncbi:MAG: uroporphyrinogen-III C-methyltransferase [Eudoraea sp.]|nr:uroporphyrinogen-III C-methyltransferase [Eudoraea sp.]